MDHVAQERYLRLQAKPLDRKRPTDIAWQQGYEAGWGNGRDIGLQPGINDLVDPMRALAILEDRLGDQAGHVTRELRTIAEHIRAVTDDSTGWPDHSDTWTAA